ncbi:hypothetical protein SPRG_17568, partial [Saprolegnia parasitica CBS 223.65]
ITDDDHKIVEVMSGRNRTLRSGAVADAPYVDNDGDASWGAFGLLSALGLWCIEQARVGIFDHNERQTLEATCQELRQYGL